MKNKDEELDKKFAGIYEHQHTKIDIQLSIRMTNCIFSL